MSRRRPKLGTRGNIPVRRSYHKNPTSNDPGCPGGGGVHIRTLTPTTWQDQAACRGHRNPDIFFPTETSHGDIQTAKAVCARCEAKTDCLVWALDNKITDGIWGGLTEQERFLMTSLHRRRRYGNRQKNQEP